MSSLLPSGTVVLLSQLHPAGSSDAGGCAQPQCCCWNWSQDGCTAGVPTSLRPVPGKSQEKGGQTQPDLARVGSHSPLTLRPPCLCRCAGSLPPRLVLRAGSPVSSAECRVSATVPHPCVPAGGHLHLYPGLPHCHSWGLQQLRVGGHLSADTPSPAAILVPRRECPCHDSPQHFPTCPGAEGKGTMPEGVVMEKKAAPMQSPHLNLKENYPGSLGWWGCHNKKHNLTKHPAAWQEGGTDPIPSGTSSDGKSLARNVLQITLSFVDK